MEYLSVKFGQILKVRGSWLYSSVPTGLSDIPGEAMVKLYCPKCMDVYTPKSSRHHHTDGAYFGTGFPHMLFMVHPEYRPKRPANQFVPRSVYKSPLTFNNMQGFVLLVYKCYNWVGSVCTVKRRFSTISGVTFVSFRALNLTANKTEISLP